MRVQQKRRAVRVALKHVHPENFDVIDTTVDGTLDFELEAEDALECDADIPEAELQPLPSDPVDLVLLLGTSPTQQQHAEILRRRYMKARSDYRARLSRYLPEYMLKTSLLRAGTRRYLQVVRMDVWMTLRAHSTLLAVALHWMTRRWISIWGSSRSTLRDLLRHARRHRHRRTSASG